MAPSLSGFGLLLVLVRISCFGKISRLRPHFLQCGFDIGILPRISLHIWPAVMLFFWFRRQRYHLVSLHCRHCRLYNPQTFTQSVSAQCGIFFWVIFRERLFLGHFPGWRVNFVETGRQLTWQLWPSHDKPSFCSAISKNQRLMTLNRNLIEIQNSAQGTKKPLNIWTKYKLHLMCVDYLKYTTKSKKVINSKLFQKVFENLPLNSQAVKLFIRN